MKIIPLDLASSEEFLKEAVEKAESFFSGAGVDYMIHNAAYERPVSMKFLIWDSDTLLYMYIISQRGTLIGIYLLVSL